MATAGIVAVEAQLMSAAQRHLQLRFGPVQSSRGDGCVLFQFAPVSDVSQFEVEVQRLCAALVRDVTSRSSLRLVNENDESNFSSLQEKAVSFKTLLNRSGAVEELTHNLDDLPDSDGVRTMLQMLYTDVVGDVSVGVQAVKEFPKAMCSTGVRFDVLLKGCVCVHAFSKTTADISSNGTGLGGGDGDDESGQLKDQKSLSLDASMLQNSFSVVKLPAGPLGKLWIDTHTLAHALSTYTTASIESELPALWRSKSFTLPESLEVLKLVHVALMDYWNNNTHNERIKTNTLSLLSMISGDIREYIKQQVLLQSADWRGPWLLDMPDLKCALQLCRDWNKVLARLTKKDWKEWDGGAFHDDSFEDFASRLHDVHRVRDSLLCIKALGEAPSRNLEPEIAFEGVSMTDLRTTPLLRWEECVTGWDKEFSFLEPKLRTHMKKLLNETNSHSQARKLTQYSVLLKRDDIRQSVADDLKAYAKYLKKQLDAVRTRYDNSLRRATTDLQKLRAAKSCETEMVMIPEQAYHIFGASSPHTQSVSHHAMDLVAVIQKDITDVQEQWKTAVETLATKLTKVAAAVVVEMQKDTKLLSCRADQSLTQFVQEVRNFRAWCGRGHTVKLSDSASGVVRVAERVLAAYHRTQQSIGNYNTVVQQMIPCTRPMLETVMERAYSQILFADQSSRTFSFTNYQELEGLGLRFQNNVETLSSENRYVRRFHCDFISQVVTLLNMDLTRHMDEWRSIVDSMRSSFDEFLSQHKFTNYDGWRRHWDCQIYKALEHQYRRGLETLHEDMEEFKVELVFKQGLVQLKPTFEAIREAYYIKLREFVSVPLRFRGLQPKRAAGGAYEIYPLMPVANNDRIITVHTKATELFQKLNRVRKAFRPYVMVGLCGTSGAPDLDAVVEAWTGATHKYNDGFLVVKEYMTKLGKIEDTMKVDCFSISTIPVKASAQEQLHRLEESLLNAMRRDMQRKLTEIDEFVFSTSNVVERQPTTMDEVGKANKAYQDSRDTMPTYEAKLQAVEAMNSELRQHSGTSIDTSATKTRWDHLREAMSTHNKVIEASVAKMRVSLDSLIQKFLKDVQRFSTNWNKQKSLLLQAFKEKAPEKVDKVLGTLKDQMKDLDDVTKESTELQSKCDYFNQPRPNFSLLDQTVKDVEKTSAMWGLYDKFQDDLKTLRGEDWLTFRSHTYLFDDFCKDWRTTLEKKLKKGDGDEDKKSKDANSANVIATYLLNLIHDWTDVLPLLKFVRGDGWMTEHWNELFRLIGTDKSKTSATLVFGDILDQYQGILAKQTEVKQLHARALGEIQLREALEELRTWGLDATFTLIEPTDANSNTKKVKLITDWKDIMTQVSDHQALVGSLRDSPFFANFADEAAGWESKLVALNESLALLNSIQRRWTYLEPIFARGALPQEQARFKRVDKEFVSILREVEADPRVMSLTSQMDFSEKLKGLLEQIERCQKSLMEYLDAKRDKLPRFYFISDEDLLEILGHSQNPSVIQAHLKKLFMGIHSVEFNKEKTAITHMVSADRERVELIKAVPITDNDVEDWLIRLDACMKATLHNLLARCVAEKDPTELSVIERYPSQVLQVAEQVQFAKAVEQAIPANALKSVQELTARQLGRLTTVSAEIDPVTTLKVKALILDVIHNSEVVELLIAKGIKRGEEWWWQKQLRYSMDAQQNCLVHMVDTTFAYTYEYQGNAAKLVHTPLTDKCYLVLTKGMGLGYGGNPYGPAGTGKTESVKALGSAMGRQVLVFNCDEGIDFKAMGRIFVGIVKCGAWGCFDEFNRLKIDQLSAISQMIQVIQQALKNGEPTCALLNKEIDVNANAGIFVTLNPAGKGYGGRTKLPDNLKQLFREVAMSVPDMELITSTMLLSEGFTHARPIAKNVVELYKLCGQLMSRQQHYDWGLRPLKAVLRLGGSLLQRKRREAPKKELSQAEESELMVQSLNINTLSKLTFDDARLFSGLLTDIFPGIKAREISYDELQVAIKAAVKALGLQALASQERKVLQLYEAMNQRMGVVLVGPSGSGKSTLLTILRKALETMSISVPMHVMNPKAMPRRRLLGYMDPDTREWYDGVLTSAAREVVKQPKEARPWILCDGDIDPEWIESLNSVLDDNKLLTMPNGVRIQFGGNVNFIFETHSLEFASPATVSRMGVLFFSDKDIHLEAVVESRLAQQSDEVRKRVLPWMMKYAFAAIDEVLRLDALSVATTRMGLLNACLSHVLTCANECDFIYALLRALGSALEPAAAPKFVAWLYKTSGQKPVAEARPLDTFWDRKTSRAAEFAADLSVSATPADFLAGHVPMVKTVEVQRWLEVLKPLVTDSACRPVFVVGPEGCGKGALIRNAFNAQKGVRTTVINCSAQTSSVHIIQKLEQTCSLSSTAKGRVFRPREGDRVVIVLKNVNLPKPDRYGTVELHSFLQQLLLYQGFYDKELEWIGIERVQLVASMSPTTSAGRYPVAPRLLAVVNIVTIAYPSKNSMTQVYAAYWGNLLRSTSIGQGKDYQGGYELATFVINVYEKIRSRFEGEEYAHFYFCPRHVTNWVTNCLLYNIDAQTTLPAVLAYEANRIFADCLPKADDRNKAEKIFAEQLATIGYSAPSKDDRFATMFVTWFSEATAETNMRRYLQQRKYAEVSTEVEAALLRYSREFKEIGMVIIPEVISWVTRVDRVLSRPGGHLIVVGRPGVGRRDTVILSAYMQRMEVVTLNMTQDYSLKNFRNDLRSFVQRATVQNTRMVLILEDQNIVDEAFLEYVNGLVISGEVPGLYTPEELDALMGPLREDAANEGFMGPIYSYFVDRLQKNLRVALIMDNKHELFLVRLQSNPGLLSGCEMLWMGAWGADVTKTMCKVGLQDKIEALEKDPANKGFHLHREMLAIHESMAPKSTPKDLEVMMHTYRKIVDGKSKSSEASIERLETGLAKLKEGEESVEKIKKDVAAKKSEVERMQKEADRALDEIQKSMASSQEQRDQAKDLQETLKEEHDDIIVKRGRVEDELSSINPLLEAAKEAVSSIRSEQLNEIRSLRTPPEPIRDVLEGVLALLGVNDVSWPSMRAFLGERGAKDRILAFNVKNVTPQILASVTKLLQQKAASFKQEVIYRASVAAAPMAEWVKAMVEYANIMDRIAPLTSQLEELEGNQKKGEEKLDSLKKKLKKIDKLVEELREEFSLKVKEAERLRSQLEKAEKELDKAQELLDKLSGEKTRWAEDTKTIREANQSMPKRALVSAAFMTYLAEAPEDERQAQLARWSQKLGLKQTLTVTTFLRTESDLLQFKSEGLPSDELSLENAVVMLDTVQTPLVIDPANQAIEWAKTHLKGQNVTVEVASLHDERFPHILELAIRFGKTLLVTEVGGIEPLLYPILRRDLISAGAKRVVQVGNKAVDWQDSFRIFLFSRSTDMKLPPGAAALVTTVNFSVTAMGLESQLLGLTIQHEKPELEKDKIALLKKEETLKLELSTLEERLLADLANSRGNLLENTQLINSLNEVKTQASNIQQALNKSQQLQKELDEKRDVYRPFAHHGAVIFFLIQGLEKLNRMYQFGLADFMAHFTNTLTQDKGSDVVAEKIPRLMQGFTITCFHSVSMGLFKADRTVFGLHLLRDLFPAEFPTEEFDALVGAVKQGKGGETAMPSWAPLSAKAKFAAVASSASGPSLIQKWDLQNASKWSSWMKTAAPETQLKDYPVIQQLLLVNTFRSDRLPALALSAILRFLRLDSLVPSVTLEDTIVSSSAASPVLLVTSSGADPSLEVQDIALHRVGKPRFTQIALGGGQTDEAMQQLRKCAVNGDWIFLKNLHLVLDWASVLEKELCAMREPHKDFRLIITTEQHDLFPSVLLRMSTKVTVEAPPGVKQNLMRTYSTWDASFLESQKTNGAQMLFGLAWFHAIAQERRTFVPQGWVKYYEFSPADLKAAVDVLVDLNRQRGSAAAGGVDWVTLKGVLETCIYGGRLDNVEDERVLSELIDTFFSEQTLVQTKQPLYGDFTVPATANLSNIVATLRGKLPDVDPPGIFFLPPNADRAVLENLASQQMEELRSLTAVASTATTSTENLRQLIAPVLELWKSSGLNTKAGAAKATIAANKEPEPMEVFFVSELNLLTNLITDLAALYQDLHAVAEGSMIPSEALRAEATELIGGRMPTRWLDRMDGPKESKLWLKLLARKYESTAAAMKAPISSTAAYDLTNMLRPQTFFNALRQHTARQSKAPLVDLVLVAGVAKSAVVQGMQVSVMVKGATVFLQGAVMAADGTLKEPEPNALSACALSTDVTVGWISRERAEQKIKGFAEIPVYTGADRTTTVFPLSVPCTNRQEALKLSLSGVAAYLMVV